jgi:hypothetical protein
MSGIHYDIRKFFENKYNSKVIKIYNLQRRISYWLISLDKKNVYIAFHCPDFKNDEVRYTLSNFEPYAYEYNEEEMLKMIKMKAFI